jgi:hypothetical protein
MIKTSDCKNSYPFTSLQIQPTMLLLLEPNTFLPPSVRILSILPSPIPNTYFLYFQAKILSLILPFKLHKLENSSRHEKHYQFPEYHQLCSACYTVTFIQHLRNSGSVNGLPIFSETYSFPYFIYLFFIFRFTNEKVLASSVPFTTSCKLGIFAWHGLTPS